MCEEYAACLVWTLESDRGVGNVERGDGHGPTLHRHPRSQPPLRTQMISPVLAKSYTELENARLVPRDQLDWFIGNDMAQFSLNHNFSINDVANGVTLRSDVHACMDRHTFALYPSEGGPY